MEVMSHRFNSSRCDDEVAYGLQLIRSIVDLIPALCSFAAHMLIKRRSGMPFHVPAPQPVCLNHGSLK
ncbi:hypothetical protein KC325_g315 [Hortaea werneckii]|nr:hypothetical protein KC325_g315 [Hortaea werneckii]